jgi:hypothetical protein
VGNATLLDALKADQPPYDVGLLETWDVGTFALFHLLGVNVTVATTAMPIFPVYLHLLGIPQSLAVPGERTFPFFL